MSAQQSADSKQFSNREISAGEFNDGVIMGVEFLRCRFRLNGDSEFLLDECELTDCKIELRSADVTLKLTKCSVGGLDVMSGAVGHLLIRHCAGDRLDISEPGVSFRLTVSGGVIGSIELHRPTGGALSVSALTETSVTVNGGKLKILSLSDCDSTSQDIDESHRSVSLTDPAQSGSVSDLEDVLRGLPTECDTWLEVRETSIEILELEGVLQGISVAPLNTDVQHMVVAPDGATLLAASLSIDSQKTTGGALALVGVMGLVRLRNAGLSRVIEYCDEGFELYVAGGEVGEFASLGSGKLGIAGVRSDNVLLGKRETLPPVTLGKVTAKRLVMIETAAVQTSGNSHIGDFFCYGGLLRVHFDQTTIAKCHIKKGTVSESQFRNCTLRAVSFQSLDFYNVRFETCDLTGADFFGASFDSRCSLSEDCIVADMKIGRYGLEQLRGATELTVSQRLALDLRDDVAKLRMSFSGYFAAAHLLGIVAFLAPYALFLGTRMILEAVGAPPDGTGRTMFGGLSEYVLKGRYWSDPEASVNWVHATAFFFGIVYNGLRFHLLRKVLKLEMQERVRQLPVNFQLKGWWAFEYWVVLIGVAGFIFSSSYTFVEWLQGPLRVFPMFEG